MSIKSKSLVTLMMILVSTFAFTSLFYYTTPYNPVDLLPPLPQVHAVTPSIILSPTSAQVGAVVSVTGTNFIAGDQGSYACLTGGAVLGSPTCTFTSGGAMSASFTVNNVLPSSNPFTITATGTTTDSATASLTVLPPSLILNPTTGQVGIHVSVSGSGFYTTDTCTTLTGTPVSAASCTITGGVLAGSFVVASGTPVGFYPIGVTTSGADTGLATATFQVTAVTVSILLTPSSAHVGATVSVSGSGYSSGDTTCTITSTLAPPISATCSVSAGTLTGSFVVTNDVPGSYTVTATGNPGGENPTATLVVLAPTLILTPSSAQVGTSVSVSGSGFYTTDICTTLTGTPVNTPSCTITGGVLTGSFLVASATPVGSYTIGVTTSGVDSGKATATFQVTPITPIISLNPSSAHFGATVQVTGTGFNQADATCAITAVAAILTSSCTISGGVVTASFVVVPDTVIPGSFTITVTGTPGSDTGAATFTLLGPSITLNPTSAAAAATVSASGLGFYTSDTGCTLSDGAALGTNSCTISNGILSGTFVVASASAGSYLITATGTGVPGGDFATANFQLTTPTPQITLTPSSPHVGATVSVTGSGFSTGDSACTLSGGTAVLSYTCSISNGVITASFLVQNTAAGPYAITATGTAAGDHAAATLTVLPPTLVLTPSSGQVGKTIQVSGSGYYTTDTCTPVTGTPVSTPSCTMTGGVLTGSFVVTGAVGSYTITETPSGGDVATANFQVTTTAQAITITPSSAQVGATVQVTGTGFSTADTTCTITGTGSSVSSYTCSISGGTLSGSFVVGNVLASLSPFTITATGAPGSDAATTSLTVLNPTLVLNPSSGQVGTFVQVSGKGFYTTDTCTTLAGTPPVSAASCTIVNGVLSGSYVVAAATAVGFYTISVTASGADLGLATASFQVTASSPTITVSPTSAGIGTSILVTGLGFSTADTTCTITGSGSVVSTGSATCSISAGKLTGSFVVASVVAAAYIITGTAAPGGEAPTTILNVLAPTINLSPNTGIIGSTVQVSGSNFARSDTSCTFSGLLTLTSYTCSISAGTLTGSFVIGQQLTGLKTVIATGNVATDSNTAVLFTITTNVATITLSSASGQAASVVTFTGSGFLTTDTACAVTTGGAVGTTPTPTCAISGGKVSGSFTVANAVAGFYTITVTGSPGTDPGTAPFQVLGPTITLTPNSAPQGTAILVTGSGFWTTDAGSCSLTPVPGPGSVIAALPASSCTINTNGKLTGIFTVASVQSSILYTITTTGAVSIESASAQILVTASVPRITLTPASGPTAIFVSVAASGFAPTDTGLTFASSPSGLWGSVTGCGVGSLTNGGCVASFQVSNSASGGYTIIATGNNAGDTAAATFTVSSGISSITLTPSTGPSGTLVSFSGVIPVGGDTSCSVGGGSGNGISLSTSTCVIVNTTILPITTVSGLFYSGTTSFSGSFVVGNLNPGTYSVRVTGSGGTAGTGVNNYVDATFIVTAPTITLSPNSGKTGISVSVSGSGFSFADNTCTLSVSQGNGVIMNGACNIGGGTGTASASFTVANVAPGTSTVRVTGSQGDYAEAIFTLTGGPSITLNPSSGGVGITVTVTGSGFQTGDSSCSISGTGVNNAACSVTVGTGTPIGTFVVYNVAPGAYVITLSASSDSAQATFTVTSGASITLNPASGKVGITVTVTGVGFRTDDSSCSISGSPVQNPSCSINLGTGTPSGSFVISNTAPGAYLITLSGSGGDSAQATFTVTGGASITLTPSSGGVGTTVMVTGSGFLTGDSSCTISGTGVQNPACTISIGTGNAVGSFVVSNISPGAYVITLSGSGGDSAQAFFTVSSGASIVLHPTSGGVGITVTVTGSGFRTDDSSCTITGSGSIVTGTACSITLGTGTATGSFVVASVSPAAYTITLTGNQGDSGTATFSVTSGPSIVLSPSSGAIGATVTVTGSGFLPADSSCALSGTPVTGGSCIITAGSGSPTGTFTVGAAAAGSYTVTLSGSGGDSAQAGFTVNVSSAMLTLYPSGSAAPGTTVTFTATGLITPDTSCTVQALPSTTIISSPTCTINPSSHVATGTFVVSNSATADNNPWTIQVVGSPGNDIVSATLTIIPVIIVTPTSGSIGTVFSFTGSGFSSAAVSCTVTISPGTWTSQSCGVSSNGQVSGSFTSGSNTAGNYAVTVADNTGLSAGSFATIGTPSAQLTISPNIVSPGQVVLAYGSGFNAGDTSCTITPTTIFTASTCSISGGVASAQFTISPSTASGLYLLTVTGNFGDFASNYVEVTIVTGTLTTTTSVSTSVTSSTYTNTTTSVSSTLTTTTFSWTGVSTATQFTLTTTSQTGVQTFGQVTTTTTTNQMTSITTVSTSQTVTGIYTLGGIIGKPLSSSSEISGDMVGLISVLSLLGLLLIRRWTF